MYKKRIAALILLTALTVLVFCLCFYVTGNATSQLPSLTQLNFNLSANDRPLTIASIEALSERISMNEVSFCAELDEVTVKEKTVVPVLTNENYFEIYQSLQSGEGITQENIENGDMVVVIGSDLALELFFNTDVVGESIIIDSEMYEIAGVYKSPDSLIDKLSGDGKQRVYVPYTTNSSYAQQQLDIIAYDNSAASAPLFEQMDLTQYHFTDFSEKSKVIKDFEHILFLILFIVLCVILIKLWYNLCKKFIHDIREDLQENYFLKSLRSIPIKYILLVLTALGIPAILLSIFFISDFSIYIVAKYIPYDNIFDVSYYLETIVANANLQNSIKLTGSTYLQSLYSNSFEFSLWLTVISVILLITTALTIYGSVKRMRKTG